MIGWILLCLLTVVLATLLLAPFSVRYDSREAAATVSLFHLGSGRLCYRDDSLWLEIVVLGMRFEWDAVGLAAKMAADGERKSQKRIEKHHFPDKSKPDTTEEESTGVAMRRVWAVLRSFRMPECIILINTGSPAHNGILYPIAWWAGRWSGKTIGINFHGESVCVVEVENALGRMLWAFIRGK